MVSPLKTRVPVLAIAHPVVAMVMVPPDGLKLPPLTLSAPFTVKSLEVVVVPVIVRLLKASVPELVMDPSVIVMVPAEGEKFALEPTLNA